MLTRSEKTYLILTLAFLAAGSGIKAWRKSSIRLGPFPDSATLALDSARAAADTASAQNTMSEGSVVGVDSMLAALPPAVNDSSTAPTRSNPAKRAGPSGDPGKVDLNRADAAALSRVKGIGAKTAQAIIEYRREHGAFRELRDLLQVKGIGEKKLEKLAPYLIL